MSKFLKKLLKGVLEEEELEKVYSSFDMIGNIAIIKIPDSLLTKKKYYWRGHTSKHKKSEICFFTKVFSVWRI